MFADSVGAEPKRSEHLLQAGPGGVVAGATQE
jgi:hypothetical protein